MLTGKIPWSGRNTGSVANIRNKENKIKEEDAVAIPEDLEGSLKEIITNCRESEPDEHPSAITLFEKYFSGKHCLVYLCYENRVNMQRFLWNAKPPCPPDLHFTSLILPSVVFE